MTTQERAEAFVAYLQHTLIPDLIESGMTATAEDFETAADLIEDLL